MINIRILNYETDLDQIVSLIKQELDKSYTKSFFIWKHLKNPFGKSYGLVALNGERIIGLRMFMIWNFLCSEHKKTINAIRPVDTVVDKKYQGKGLFKKLTLQGLEDFKNDYELIFNTPNNNSLPGYIKMGWDQLKVGTNFQLILINPFIKTLPFHVIPPQELDLNFSLVKLPGCSTLLSSEFISWRYKEKDYKMALFKIPGHFIIYKRGSNKNIPVLFILEINGVQENIGRMLNSLGKKFAMPFLYTYYKNLPIQEFTKTFERLQPVIVIKKDLTQLGGSLNLSLGDLQSKL